MNKIIFNLLLLIFIFLTFSCMSKTITSTGTQHLKSMSLHPKMKSIDSGNTETNEFISWYYSSKYSNDGNILILNLDDNLFINDFVWNVCAYADIQMLNKILSLKNLKKVNIVINPKSISKSSIALLKTKHKQFKFNLNSNLQTLIVYRINH